MRRSSRVALSAIATLGVAGTASAAPTVPTFVGTLPPFVRGSVPLTWTPSTFTDLSTARGYEIAITETPPLLAPASETATAFTWNPANGFSGAVSITMTATEKPCATIALGPPPSCTAEGTVADPSASSSALTTSVDNVAPTGGTLQINSGAVYTRSADVTLNATPATDPGGSGGVKVQLAEGATGAIPCATAGAPGCPTDVFTSLPFTLTGTADGFRAVRAIYRDAAVTAAAPTPLADGNATAPVSDSIFLDRRDPIAVPTATPASVQVGRTVTFGSSGSSDPNGANGSGLDSAGYTWSFGAGAAGSGGGASPTRTYTTAGTKTVTLTVRDRAGRTSASVPVTVTVTNPPPAVPTPAPGGGGATAPGGGTTGGTPPVGSGGGGAAPVPARFVTRLRLVGKVIEGKQMKIALEVRGRVIITVSLVKVRSNGKLGKVVRTFTGLKSGRFGVRFTAPKAGRYRLVARTGGQRRSSIVTVSPSPVVAVDPQPVPAASK